MVLGVRSLRPVFKDVVSQAVSFSQGTAVFWYNLLRSGEGDYRTRHAACPVLVGCKWGEWLKAWCGLGGLSLGFSG